MQTTAAIEQTILNNIRQLPPEKQQEVLDFTEALRPTPLFKQAVNDLQCPSGKPCIDGKADRRFSSVRRGTVDSRDS